MNYEDLFGKPAEEVALDLIGRTISRKLGRGYRTGIITETGAYEDGREIQAREGMKYAPGTVFLMPFRGKYLFNIATEEEGIPSCVEIRQVQIKDYKITGSGRITKALSLLNLDGRLLGEELNISGAPVNPLLVKKTEGTAKNCVGYFSLK